MPQIAIIQMLIVQLIVSTSRKDYRIRTSFPNDGVTTYALLPSCQDILTLSKHVTLNITIIVLTRPHILSITLQGVCNHVINQPVLVPVTNVHTTQVSITTYVIADTKCLADYLS